MTNWDIYVRESYDIVRRAECELTVNLAHEIEAYVVHLFAYYLDKPLVNTEPICIKLLESNTKPVTQRKQILKEVGDECLLINAMEWGKNRWPSDSYYADMGQMAYVNRAFAERPPEDLFDDLAYQFQTATKVLRKCRIS
jgi:hypothetical protein